jgi:antibiotic biosynthesis monooxygenase (ABM) superfamily enzyme
MNPFPPDSRPLLEVRERRASSVIVQRIPLDAAEAFLEWQRGITATAALFPGFHFIAGLAPDAAPRLAASVAPRMASRASPAIRCS